MFLVKFGQTIYEDRENIGSGNDLIQGNKKSRLTNAASYKDLVNFAVINAENTVSGFYSNSVI